MPTVLGAIVALIGCYLLIGRSVEAMLAFVIVTTLMNGASAISLGSSSVIPALVALMFLAVRLFLPGTFQMGQLRRAVISNALLIVFTCYAVFSAVILPRLFKNQVFLIPVKAIDPHGLRAAPLAASMTNITTAFYICSTLVMALCAFVVSRRSRAADWIVITGVVASFTHCLLGWGDLLFGSTPLGVIFEFFRNAHYAQLSQEVGGLIRIKGISPEPSAFSALAIYWFVFMSELWLRGIRSLWTGGAALTLLVTLVASTSTTAYAGVTIYGVVLAVRSIVFFGTIPSSKLLLMLIVGFVGVTAIIALMTLRPSFASHVGTIFLALTVHKGASSSGQERLAMALQGFAAFRASYGFGVGVGSFNSSSFATAVLGATGVVGVLSFLFYVLHVLKPLRRSTYQIRGDLWSGVGASASWTLVCSLVEQSLSGSSADPGIMAGLFAGIALGCRSFGQAVRYRRSQDAVRHVDDPGRIGYVALPQS